MRGYGFDVAFRMDSRVPLLFLHATLLRPRAMLWFARGKGDEEEKEDRNLIIVQESSSIVSTVARGALVALFRNCRAAPSLVLV